MDKLRRIIVLLLLATCARAAAGAAWTHDAYIWQRKPAAQVNDALRASSGQVNGYCVLASEISWDKASPKIVRPRFDYAGLASLEKPIGLALRIGTRNSEKQFADALPQIIAEASALLEFVRNAGLAPSELQIDFDCPESKLGLYRGWLAALKTAAGETPLTFTALPCWLQHEREFVDLARAADGFVLQVHSLDKPRAIDDTFTLCEPGAALHWCRGADGLAARAGTRFRVALPTYGYTLGFDDKGRFIGLAAETPRDWPPGAQLRTVRSDPRAMQALAQTLAAEKLPRATGIIWFRLPAENDRLAWTGKTFSAVIEGGEIISHLAVEIHRAKPGLAEIVIINRGHTTEPLPQRVKITWSGDASLESRDGLGGYSFYYDRDDPRALVGMRSLASTEIAPGHSRVIGWVRFDFPDKKPITNISINATIP
ncbi:hypothetical protein M2103_000511 [Ereboglobus sp. PH5-5]|uniref:DUF3142 domain-containing protein n=1 Tax=Ereboglobus sp. PH5-5 TaxID=2940529 RepID=UPI002405BE77|nr:DUF3142 domain-containing protein [Ereboglobus sp. PH5-5]MDF9832301.1 hypothetical protein [Ereboglobus sp. PH5-5]